MIHVPLPTHPFPAQLLYEPCFDTLRTKEQLGCGCRLCLCALPVCGAALCAGMCSGLCS